MPRLSVAVGAAGSGLFGGDINATIFGSPYHVASFLPRAVTGANGIVRADLASGALQLLRDAAGGQGVFTAVTTSSVVRRPLVIAAAIPDLVGGSGGFSAARSLLAADGGPNFMQLSGVTPNWDSDFGFAMIARPRGTATMGLLGRQASGTSRACLQRTANQQALSLYWGSAFATAPCVNEVWALVLGGVQTYSVNGTPTRMIQLEVGSVRATDVAVGAGDGAPASAFVLGSLGVTGTSPYSGDFLDVNLFSKSLFDPAMAKVKSALRTKAGQVHGLAVGAT